MRRTVPPLVAVLVVVATVAVVPVATVAAQTETVSTATETPVENENASVQPGQQLAGVVGVQAAELDGDVKSRAYGIAVDRAASNGSKAAVVADRLANVEERLDRLEDRKDALERARENGSMSEGEYRAKVATLHARTRNTERMANETNDTAAGLPAEELEAKGINATAIRTLKDRANELSGPETAAIARSIAGNDRGPGARPDHAANRSDAPGDGPGASGNASDGGPPDHSNASGPDAGSGGDATETESEADGQDEARDNGNAADNSAPGQRNGGGRSN